MNKYVNSENGVSSLMAVFSLAVLMVIVGGIATMTIANSYENKNNKDTMQVQYAAEAGLKKALVSFDSYNKDTNNEAFDWLPENAKKNDLDNAKKDLYSYYNDANKKAKASYTVFISKVDENDKDKKIIINDTLKGLKETKKDIEPGTYYITSYGFVDAWGNKKKVASAVIKYGENGGGGGLDTETEDNKPGSPNKGKIALYSDTQIDITNNFHLNDFNKDGTNFYTAIAANGPIGQEWWTTGGGGNHPSYKVLDNVNEEWVKDKTNKKVIDIDFDYNKIPQLDYKSKNYYSKKFSDKKDELNNLDKELDNLAKNLINMNKTISKQSELSGKIAVECTGINNNWNGNESKIDIGDETKKMYVKVNGNIGGSSDVNITNSKVIVNGNISLDSTGKCTFKNSIIEAQKISGGKNVEIDNCLINIDNIDNLWSYGGNITIKNSIINVKNFTPGVANSIIENSEINADYIDFANNSKITNSIVHSNTAIQCSKLDITNGILFSDGEKKGDNSICGKDGINDGVFGIKADMGLSCTGAYLQAKSNIIIKNSSELILSSSIINSSKSIHFTNGAGNLKNMLILADEHIAPHSIKQRVINSFMKTFEGKIIFSNAIDLVGVILAKDLIMINNESTLEYNDGSFSQNLINYLGDIISSNGILNNFESFLGIQERQEGDAPPPQYGNEDYTE
ncbi:MAG: hypothetical protein ACI3ZR_00830 [bacterium]